MNLAATRSTWERSYAAAISTLAHYGLPEHWAGEIADEVSRSPKSREALGQAIHSEIVRRAGLLAH